MTTSKSETRRFGMHANLLYDVITKQAGTLEKAILEGVMNGVDAGASRIDVTLDHRTLTIRDDGKGFVDRSEIENFFETFGTPHEEGDATYGRFRMGRGQLFAFGVNAWRTNSFEMDVDIKSKGLDYDLRTVPDHVQGCSITVSLYKELLPSERDSVEREIRTWIAWVSIPVTINGVVVSKNPAEGKWDVETDDAWIKLAPSKSTLAIYNLGVRVTDAPAHKYGVGGTVVSKHRLDVNFARNDVQSDCEVFKRIKTELRKHADKETSGKRKLSDTEKQHLAHRLVAGDLGWDEAISASLFTDVEGRHFSLDALIGKLWRNSHTIVSARRGDRVAIKVQQQTLATTLSTETLERFDAADLVELVESLKGFCDHQGISGYHANWRARNMRESLDRTIVKTVNDFRHMVSETYESVEPKRLKAGQKMMLNAIHRASMVVAGGMSRPYRKILAGRSEVANGWTDGVTAIWIEMDQLKLLSNGFQGCTRVAALLVHEYLHDGPDTETHEHDEEFLSRFHDIAVHKDLIGDAATVMMRSLAEQSRRNAARPGTKVSAFEDLEARLVQSGGAGSPVVELQNDEDSDEPIVDESTVSAEPDEELPLGRAA
jgi:hypothetical protein